MRECAFCRRLVSVGGFLRQGTKPHRCRHGRQCAIGDGRPYVRGDGSKFEGGRYGEPCADCEANLPDPNNTGSLHISSFLWHLGQTPEAAEARRVRNRERARLKYEAERQRREAMLHARVIKPKRKASKSKPEKLKSEPRPKPAPAPAPPVRDDSRIGLPPLRRSNKGRFRKDEIEAFIKEQEARIAAYRSSMSAPAIETIVYEYVEDEAE